MLSERLRFDLSGTDLVGLLADEVERTGRSMDLKMFRKITVHELV